MDWPAVITIVDIFKDPSSWSHARVGKQHNLGTLTDDATWCEGRLLSGSPYYTPDTVSYDCVVEHSPQSLPSCRQNRQPTGETMPMPLSAGVESCVTAFELDGFPQQLQPATCTDEAPVAQSAFPTKLCGAVGCLSSTASPPQSISGNQEEHLLLELKDRQNRPWKVIVEQIQAQSGKAYSVPALQMRYRRLRRRRLLDISNADLAALLQAYDYWETKRWTIISQEVRV